MDYLTWGYLTSWLVDSYKTPYSRVIGNIQTDSQETSFIEVQKFCIKCDENGLVDCMNAFLGCSADTMLYAALYDHTENSFKYMICQYVTDNMSIPKEY